MENAKYVCIDTDEAGPALFIFPPLIGHVDFCQRYFGSWWWEDNKMCRAKVLSAGFVRADILDEMRCIGESSGLKLKSRPEDTTLLRRMFV